MSATLPPETVILTEAEIQRSLKRLTHELLESNGGCEDLVLIGIVTRGKILAERVGEFIQQFENKTVPVGHLDITLYRDDAGKSFRAIQGSQIPVDITDKKVVLVDDVMFSGRTVRAALDALNDYGRPSRVQLLVLLDRGHRQLPISPDFIGKNLPTSLSERVQVRLAETDGTEQVTLGKS